MNMILQHAQAYQPPHSQAGYLRTTKQNSSQIAGAPPDMSGAPQTTASNTEIISGGQLIAV